MPGNHLAIISRELFEKCQEVCKQRAAHLERGWEKCSSNVYPLSELVYCLECGSCWKGWNTDGARRYRDPARNHRITCEVRHRSVRAEALESQVFSLISKMMLPDDW